MTSVLIHPSRGHRDGRINWTKSLDVAVDFVAGEVGTALTARERTALLIRHPDGKAHFWGTYAHNADLIHRIREGDVVVFTGEGGVRGLGTVGYMFDNPAFAERLWVESEGKGTYRHIYSLRHFESVRLDYGVLNVPLGYNPRNAFQGMAVYDDPVKANALIKSLQYRPSPMEEALYDEMDARLAEELESEIVAAAPLAALERVLTFATATSFEGGTRTVRRGEGSLVMAYAASLGSDVFGRNFTANGITDMCIDRPGGRELIEAKSVAARAFVRQALAQLLDYGPAVRPRPAILTALFPESPDSSGVDLLHRYGIDCVFRRGPGHFARLPASAAARNQLLQLQK